MMRPEEGGKRMSREKSVTAPVTVRRESSAESEVHSDSTERMAWEEVEEE